MRDLTIGDNSDIKIIDDINVSAIDETQTVTTLFALNNDMLNILLFLAYGYSPRLLENESSSRIFNAAHIRHSALQTVMMTLTTLERPRSLRRK
ncbi:MAG: hypothetical protein SAK29_13105 [Scytonema sp. PMC 1069.18]|nr:hypothetical protein [Scytonema sp. PMC 1069.18]MEC4880940.1 hypothetical protein [Scytonema sp. PMC 1070.18]